MFHKILRVWEPQRVRRQQLVRQQVRKHKTNLPTGRPTAEKNARRPRTATLSEGKKGDKVPLNALADAHVPEARILHTVDGGHMLKGSVDISAKLFRLHKLTELVIGSTADKDVEFSVLE